MATPGAYMNANQQGDGAAVESEGAAGAGEPTPARAGGGMSDEGEYNSAAQNANASQHGRPAISEKPDNLTGSIESSGPSRSEGDIGIQQYPYVGPPSRTTAPGGSGNPYEGDGGL